MWWSNSSDKDPKAAAKDTPAETSKKADAKDASPFDPNRLPKREKLPPAMQRIVEKSEKEDNFFDELVDG
jgi:fission process protein 1